MKAKSKKCKYCKQPFMPRFSSFQKCCENPTCVIENGKEDKKKEFQSWKKKVEEKNKTHSDYENELQPVINEIARLIDKGHNCISHEGKCKKLNGGHYHSVGSNNSVRFNLFNLYLQCFSCNGFKSSNRTGYDEGLKREFGHEHWLYVNEGMRLEYPHVKLTIPELKEAIAEAKRIVKELLITDIIYTNELRLRLRETYNKRLKIYTHETKR
jgi:hypothetical protein